MAATAAALTVFAGCQRVEQDAPLPEETAPEAEESSAIIPGELIVELSEEMTEAIASLSPEEAGAMLGVISAERMYADAGEWEPRHREAGLHRWYVLTYDPASMTSTKAAEETLLIPGVVYTEPVRKIKPTAIFNDPDLGKQWHYYNDGTLTSSHKAGCDINVLPVWENFTTGDSKVIVSVVDGGIDMSHYDLAAVTIPVISPSPRQDGTELRSILRLTRCLGRSSRNILSILRSQCLANTKDGIPARIS